MTFIKIAVVSTLVIVAGYAVYKTENTEKKMLRPELLEATDARDPLNPIFQEAISTGEPGVFSLLGHIGGAACTLVAENISHSDAAIRNDALQGAAYCYGDGETGPALLARLPEISDPQEKDLLLVALGFSGDENATKVLIENFDASNKASVYALTQNIVYDRLPASGLPGLPFDKILTATADPKVGYFNAYLLTRLQGLDQVYDLSTVEAAIAAAQDSAIKMVLVRVLRQFGDAAASALLSLAESGPAEVRVEAVSAMARLSDQATKDYLVALMAGEDQQFARLAVAAFAGRDMDDANITNTLLDLTQNSEGWLATTAFASFTGRDAEAGQRVAEEWLNADDFSRAFKAMTLLAQNDDGRKMLQHYADTHEPSVRVREALIALDPTIEARVTKRAVPSLETLQSYAGKRLELTTSRGTILIRMEEKTPYAATNFLQLAESGKMDGMLWHRVIPNFVAQAGQTEDLKIYDWGSIREEWDASDHIIGSVGLATAGRDTGSTQFYINTAHNVHLNGRYTVFGHVVAGLEVAAALQEGDKIIKAVVLPAG